MADFWVALITGPAQEYLAATELQRFGLDPYLPQGKRRVAAPAGRGAALVTRRYPIFPRYVLLGIDQAAHPAVREARGLIKIRPILAANDGTPWRCPSVIINAVRDAESTGEFDELTVTGSKVKLTDGILSLISARMASPTGTNRVELLTPLFGGARVTVSSSRLVRA